MNRNLGIIGKKVGVTQVFGEDGNVTSCTVVQSDSVVVGKRTADKDGYTALVVGSGDRKEKHTRKPQLGAAKKAGVAPKRILRELRCSAEDLGKYEIGQPIKVEDLFEAGQLVDVQSLSRGRGFQGVIKRHNFAGSVTTHGTHEYRRHGGSLGTNMTPGRVVLGRKMAGQMGNVKVTVQNLRVVKVVPEQQLVLLDGGVPGAPNTIVRLLGAIKRPNAGKPKKAD
ncbi:MAG: 50S ribosomal protein L3 [Myxococcales bacterium]|nr:50S ribosomal protein L3 [Myxococcales bacterium]